MDTVKCLVAKGVHADIEDCDGVVIHKSTTENRHELVPHQRSCIYHFYMEIKLACVPITTVYIASLY